MSDLTIPQEFHNENRDLFKGNSAGLDISKLQNKCPHYFERVSYSQVKCKLCNIGYYDSNRFILQDGKIVGVK
jgi:hypothetical protein